MSTATERALAIAELRKLILERVDQPKALGACLRVCRAWYEDAVPLLWRGRIELEGVVRDFPDADHLDDLAEDPDRFRHYLRHVKYLHLRCGQMKEEFPRLWNAQLWREPAYRCLIVQRTLSSGVRETPRVDMLLHDNLRAVLLYGAYHPYGFLKKLPIKVKIVPASKPSSGNKHGCTLTITFGRKERPDAATGAIQSQPLVEDYCPNLQWLLLGTAGADFPLALQALQQLQGLELLNQHSNAWDEPTWLLISNFPRLRYLSIGYSTPLTHHILEASDHRLRELRSLKVAENITGEALRMLLPQLSHLREFHLYASGLRLPLGRDVIVPLSHCPELISLKLHAPWPWNIFRDELGTFVGHCKKLRSFELERHDMGVEEGYESVLEAVPQLVENLHELEVLIYDGPCTLHEQALVDIARGCPRLHYLSVRGSLNLASFILLDDFADDVVFPALEEFEVGYFASVEGLEAEATFSKRLQGGSILDLVKAAVNLKLPRLISVRGSYRRPTSEWDIQVADRATEAFLREINTSNMVKMQKEDRRDVERELCDRLLEDAVLGTT